MADAELLVSISADISGLTSQLSEASSAIGDFANSGTEAGDKLGNLNSKLGDVGESTKAAGESSAALGTAFEGLGEDVTGVGEKIGEMIGGPMGSLVGAMSGAEAGAIAVGAAFAELTIHEAEWAEQLVNTSLILGTTTTELQTLQSAADLTGTNVDRLGRMVEMMTRTLETGSTRAKTMSDALNKMGISGADLGDVNTMLLKMSEYLEKTGGDTEQNRQLLVELGRGWLQILPFVLQYGDASKQVADLALTLNQQQITDLHSAADAWNQLKAVVGVLAEELAATLAPAFVEIVQTITTVIEIFRTWGEEVGDVLNGMQVLLGDAFATMLLVVQDFAVGAGTLLKDVFTLNWSAIRADFNAAWVSLEGDFKANTAKYQADWATTINNLVTDTQKGVAAMNAAMAAIKPPPVAVPGGGAGLGVSAADLKKAAEDRLKVREEEASEQAKIEDAQLAATQKHYETEYNLGNITLEQEYAGLTDVENKKYEAQMAAYEKDLAALKDSGVAKQSEIVKIQGDEEVLTAKHNATLEDLRAKLSLAQDTADQQDEDEALSTQQAEAAAEKTIQDSRLAVLQAWLNQRVALGRESGRQEVADQTTIDNLKYNEDRKALTDRLAVLRQYYDDKSKEVIKANTDIEALDNQHYAKLISDQTKADQQQLTLVKDAMAQISTAFGNAWDTLFQDAVAGSTKQQSVWSKMFSDILKLAEGWAQQMGKTLLEALLFGNSGGPGAQAQGSSSAIATLLGLGPGGLLGGLLGGGSSSTTPGGGGTNAQQTAAFQTAITSFQTASDNFNRILTGSTAAGASTTNSLANITNNLNTAVGGVDSAGQDLTKASDNTQSAADATDTSAKDLGTAAGTTGDSASALGQTTNALGETVNSFDASVSTFSDASGTLGNSASAMSEAATGLSDATDGLVSVSDALGTAVTDLGNAAGGGGGGGAPGGAGSSGIGSSISTAIANGFTNAQGVLNSIMTNAINQLLAPLTKVFTDVFNAIVSPITNVFTSAVNALLTPLTTVFSGAMGAIESTVTSVFTGALDGSAPAATSVFEAAFGGSGTTVGDIFSTGFSSSTKTIGTVFSDAWDTLTKVVGNVFSGAWDGLTKVVGDIFGGAFDSISGTLSKLFDGIFGGIFSSLSSALSSVLGGSGIASALGGIGASLIGGGAGAAIGGAVGGSTGAAVGGIVGSVGGAAVSLATGNLIGAALGGAEAIAGIVGLFAGSGRPTMEATQDAAQYAGSPDPVLRLLGLGAQKLVSQGIPLSSPDASSIFGPYFGAAVELEAAVRWQSPNAGSVQSVDTATLADALGEMGNPSRGSATINAMMSAWSEFAAGGNLEQRFEEMVPASDLTAIKSLLGIQSFQFGGISSGGLSFLHPNEMVLPADISTLLQGLTPSSAGTGATVVFQISAIDSQDVERFISDNRDSIADAVFSSSRGFRNLGRSF